MDQTPNIKNEKYGDIISDTLAKYLKLYLTNSDRGEIAKNYSVSPSTIRDVIYQRNPLTENNEPAIKATIELAVLKSREISKEAIQAAKHLNAL